MGTVSIMLKLRETFDLRPDWVDIRAEVNSAMIFQVRFTDEGIDLTDYKVTFSVEDKDGRLLLYASTDNSQAYTSDGTIYFEIPAESVHDAAIPPGIYRYAIALKAVSGLSMKVVSGNLYLEEGV